MQKNNWVFGLVVVLIIVGLSIWGFGKNKTPINPAVQPTANSVNSGEAVPTADNLIKSDEPYFDANASVMEFYQPSCGWCIKESEVLNVLAKQGYRVKPVDGTNQALWQKYGVTGTPTFVAINGDKIVGYQTEEQLKTFLDAHK